MGSTAEPVFPPPCHSIGHWLPKDRNQIKQYVGLKLDQLANAKELRNDPTIAAMQKTVDTDSHLKKLSEDMFIQIPPAYKEDPTGRPQVEHFDKMLALVNLIIKEGPQWYYLTDLPTAMGLIGFPINAILDWPMGTQAGYDFFRHPEVNRRWHDILCIWGTFLKSEKSLPCLDTSKGWLSAVALSKLEEKGNDAKTKYSFDQLYVCDKTKPYWGFRSWDDFFTRQFRPGIRPLGFADDIPEKEGEGDHKSWLVNACESGPLQYVTNVKIHDTFWLKEQPYSLAAMLDNDPLASSFIGGSVYQAFLSALSYHCWHAPCSGTVVRTAVVRGTYYSENLYQGFLDPEGPDPSAANNSQPYISAVATRGIIFIQADNPSIGLMAIVFIGMAEVSSCDFTVCAKDKIVKGQPIGKFHFGGSSHCMVFGPSTKLRFVNPPPWTDPNAPNNQVNSVLALVE